MVASSGGGRYVQQKTPTLVVLQSKIDPYLTIVYFYFLIFFYAFIYFTLLPTFKEVLRAGLCRYNQ